VIAFDNVMERARDSKIVARVRRRKLAPKSADPMLPTALGGRAARRRPGRRGRSWGCQGIVVTVQSGWAGGGGRTEPGCLCPPCPRFQRATIVLIERTVRLLWQRRRGGVQTGNQRGDGTGASNVLGRRRPQRHYATSSSLSFAEISSSTESVPS